MLVVDAKSKWPEVLRLNRASTESAIEGLSQLFARFGIPRQLVADNGPAFASVEFQQFVERNGIHHITTAPYSPKTNGEAERFVKTFKMAMKAERKSPSRLAMSQLQRFLLTYRNTPHTTTRISPAEALLGDRL